MSESPTLKKVAAFKQQCLEELLAQCTPAQRALFNRLYPLGVHGDRQYATAVKQCEATIVKNNTPPAKRGRPCKDPMNPTS